MMGKTEGRRRSREAEAEKGGHHNWSDEGDGGAQRDGARQKRPVC